jgi:hypothetical protein
MSGIVTVSLVAIVIVILVSGVYVAVKLSTSNTTSPISIKSTSQTGSTSTGSFNFTSTIQNTTSDSTQSFQYSAESSNSSTGLELELSTNSTTFGEGQTIALNITEFNLLSTYNNLTASTDWPSQTVSIAVCDYIYPLRIGVFQGNYGPENISSAPSDGITFNDPNVIYACPAIPATPYYSFQPMSDIASSCIGTQGPSCYTPMSYSVDFNGTWVGNASGYGNNNSSGYTQSLAVLQDLSPGSYTVVGGDEWGGIVLLHFSVVSHLPVQVISIIGPIPPYNPGGPVVSITLKNRANTPITFLNAILMLPTAEPSVVYPFIFDVNESSPLLQNQTIQSTRTLIGAGFETGTSYPLVISGTLSDGLQFNFTQPIEIVPPSQNEAPCLLLEQNATILDFSNSTFIGYQVTLPNGTVSYFPLGGCPSPVSPQLYSVASVIEQNATFIAAENGYTYAVDPIGSLNGYSSISSNGTTTTFVDVQFDLYTNQKINPCGGSFWTYLEEGVIQVNIPINTDGSYNLSNFTLDQMFNPGGVQFFTCTTQATSYTATLNGTTTVTQSG